MRMHLLLKWKAEPGIWSEQKRERDFREEFHFFKVLRGRLKLKGPRNGNSGGGNVDESFILAARKLAVSAQFISRGRPA